MEKGRLFKELTCPRCFNVLNKPFLTPCGHNLCATCLRSFGEGRNFYEFRCPTCSSMISSQDCTPNQSLDVVIQQLSNLCLPGDGGNPTNPQQHASVQQQAFRPGGQDAMLPPHARDQIQLMPNLGYRQHLPQTVPPHFSQPQQPQLQGQHPLQFPYFPHQPVPQVAVGNRYLGSPPGAGDVSVQPFVFTGPQPNPPQPPVAQPDQVDADVDRLVLTHNQRQYIRYIVVTDCDTGIKYTVGIKHVLNTAGSNQLVQLLEKNIGSEYKKGSSKRACKSVVHCVPCAMKADCPFIHVTPEGWEARRKFSSANQKRSKDSSGPSTPTSVPHRTPQSGSPAGEHAVAEQPPPFVLGESEVAAGVPHAVTRSGTAPHAGKQIVPSFPAPVVAPQPPASAQSADQPTRPPQQQPRAFPKPTQPQTTSAGVVASCTPTPLPVTVSGGFPGSDPNARTGRPEEAHRPTENLSCAASSTSSVGPGSSGESPVNSPFVAPSSSNVADISLPGLTSFNKVWGEASASAPYFTSDNKLWG